MRVIHGLLILMVAGIMAAGSAAGQSVTLQVYGGYPPESPAFAVLDEYLRLYEAEHPWVRIENLGREHNPDKLVTLFLAGEAPDIIELSSEVLVQFYTQGFLAPAPAHLAERLRETNFPISVRSLTVGGDVVAVPNENMVTGLMYNRRVLAESGIGGPPETLDELEMVGRRLARWHADGTLARPGLVEAGEAWSLTHFGLALLKAEGGAVVDEDGRVTLDADPIYRVIDRFLNWRGLGGGQPFLGFGWDQVAEFWQGNVGLGFGYTFWMGEARNLSPDAYPGEFGVTRLPRGSAGYGELHYGHGYAVPASSRNQEEAWKLLEWLNQKMIGESTPSGHTMAAIGSLPLNTSDIASSYFAAERELYEGFIANLEHSIDIAEYVQFGVIDTRLGPVIQAVLAGEASPQQAVHQAVIDIQAQIERASR